MIRRWFSNDDIPTNILSRLPAKTLQCLKYVSKDWYSLISSRSFIRFQLKKKEPVVGFFVQEIFEWVIDDVKHINYIPVETETVSIWRNVLSFLPEEEVVVLSSSNGLLCCRSCFPTSTPRMYVCNPLNKQWMSVRWHNLPKSTIVALAFDPFRNPIDASTNFKLVAVTETETSEDEFCFSFDIYSPEANTWRRSKEQCPCNHVLIKNNGVFVDGNLYWLTDGFQVLMFDPENEMSWLITTPLPATQFNSTPEMCIGVSEDKLNYVIISEDGLQLWVLEDHFSSLWGLKFSMSLVELERANSHILRGIRDKVVSRICEESWMDPLAFEDGVLLLRVSTHFCSYKFETREMKILSDVFTLGPKSMFSPIVVPYAMSLVPLDIA